MKKVFLVLLCAGLFVACGNKNKQAEEAIDTTAVEEVVTETVVEEQPVVAEQPAATTTTTKKEQPAKKEVVIEEEKSIGEHAKKSAENVGKTVITKVEKDATEAVEISTPNKKRR